MGQNHNVGGRVRLQFSGVISRGFQLCLHELMTFLGIGKVTEELAVFKLGCG